VKLLILCLTLFLTIQSFANNYYVATDGNNSNPGTFAQPWLTWDYAFSSSSVNAGDTVFIRGGVYNITVTDGSGYGVTRTGTADNWIVYTNYPGEVPILDCSAATPTGQYNGGIGGSARSANYVKFRGLTVRNVYQKRTDVMVWATGFGMENGNFIFENCTAYNIEGVGFESYFYDGWPDVDGYHYFINCDAYECSNPEVIPGYLPGNNGSGFSSTSFTSTRGHAYAINCRAWECGDQGFVFSGEHYCETDGCWSFNNGDLQGNGHGFKIGWHSLEYPETGRLNVVLTNCISAYNRYSGITTNDAQGVATGMNIYNNLIYANGHYSPYIYGIYIYDTPDNETNELLRIFRNNISFDNEYGEIYVAAGASYTHSNNSWDGGATITSADFTALPSTMANGIALLSSARQSDGSLPDLGSYFKLAEGSDAIDAGVDVGLPYSGAAPDLGSFEYDDEIQSTATDILTFTLAEQTGAATINATSHTVSIEVAYTADITDLTPTITLSYGATIDPLSGVSQDFTNPVTYTVTALDEVTEQEWVVTVTQAEAPSTHPRPVMNGTKPVMYGTKMVIMN